MGPSFSQHLLSSVPSDASVRALVFSSTSSKSPVNKSPNKSATPGSLWIGTTAGLIESRDGVEHLSTTRDGLADDWIFSLGAGRDGTIWIGTRNGFSRLNHGGEIDSFRPQDGLSQSTVFSVYEDAEASLWVGTKHGLNQFLDGRAIPYTVNEGLPTNETGPVLKDKRGDMWIGTLGAGLSRYNGRHFSTLSARNGLPSVFVNALAEDKEGSLWVGTTRGLSRLKDGRVEQTFTVAQGLPSNAIRGLLADSSGVLWIATSAGAAALRHGKIERPAGLDLREPVLAIGEDGAHRIYFATANNVRWLANGRSDELLNNGAPIRGADAFYRDREGLLWLGTLTGGLRMVENTADKPKISTFLMRDGLYDAEIYGIAGDEQDRLWMACSKGIFWVARADLRRFAAGDLKKLISNPYSPTDALRVIECKAGVQPAAAMSGDGRMWFSTIRGMIVFGFEASAEGDGPARAAGRRRYRQWRTRRVIEYRHAAAGPQESGIQLHRTDLSATGAANVSLHAGGLRQEMGGRRSASRGVLYEPAAGHVYVSV